MMCTHNVYNNVEINENIEELQAYHHEMANFSLSYPAPKVKYNIVNYILKHRVVTMNDLELEYYVICIIMKEFIME